MKENGMLINMTEIQEKLKLALANLDMSRGLHFPSQSDKEKQYLQEVVYRQRDRIGELENAIKEHRAQKSDDRCWMDDDKLYEVLGDGIKGDYRVGNKEEMKKNCDRFIENRCVGGGWKTYKELEEENKQLHNIIIKFSSESYLKLAELQEKYSKLENLAEKLKDFKREDLFELGRRIPNV